MRAPRENPAAFGAAAKDQRSNQASAAARGNIEPSSKRIDGLPERHGPEITPISSWQIGEEGRRHLRRELHEEPILFRDVAISEMDER